jgi:sensor histidine kinase regulating citrate/malate metabolism
LGTYSMKLLSRFLRGDVSFSSSNEKGTIFSVKIPTFY